MPSVTDGCSLCCFPASCHAQAQRLARTETPTGAQASWRPCIVYPLEENRRGCPAVACPVSVPTTPYRLRIVVGLRSPWLLVPERHLVLAVTLERSCRVLALTSFGSSQIPAHGSSH